MQAGQKLSRHIRKEFKEADLERKISHIEQFGPILVDGLARIAKAPESRKRKAEEGLRKLLGRDTRDAEKDLSEAHDRPEQTDSAGIPRRHDRHSHPRIRPAPRTRAVARLGRQHHVEGAIRRTDGQT